MKKIKSTRSIIAEAVKKILSEFLGIEKDDIENDDSLKEELHMTAADLSELKQIIEDENISTTNLDFTQIETVEELIENLDENATV